MNLKKSKSLKNILFFGGVMLIAILSRILFLGKIPGGINEDEAFAGYEAYCLMTTGRDSFGYRFPVYLTTWGSGMNALQTYLIIPFLYVFGNHAWVIRIPQVCIGICTVCVSYFFLKEFVNERAAILGMMLIAICPWHIMMSRWALEANLAPGFLLFGMYFFAKASKNPRYFLAAALFYGLGLYAYALIWLIVPVIILLQFLYICKIKGFQWNWWVFAAVVVVFTFAAPLLGFIMVNKGFLPELQGKIFSIPKLLYMRSDEINIRNFRHNAKNLMNLLVFQYDGTIWGTTVEFGLYYKWLVLFAIPGIMVCIRRTLNSFRQRTFAGEAFILIAFLCPLFQGCFVEVDTNRINSIYLSILMLMALGMDAVVNLAQSRKIKAVMPCLVGGMLALFICFWNLYTTDYARAIAIEFHDGIEEAVTFAEEKGKDGRNISITPYVGYPVILFCSEINPEEYRNSVVYKNYPNAFLNVNAFKNFEFDNTGFEPGKIYITIRDDAQFYREKGLGVEEFGTMAVIYEN